MKVFYDDKCQITCTDNDRVVEAEIMNYRPKDNLTVVVATNKIHMKWNGKVFVGNAQGLEFTSPGPIEHVTREGRGL
jgi:hypothetical protein